jgi:hypothetical protein
MDRKNVAQDVAHLAKVWIAAELRGDSAFLEGTLADDFVAVGPLGFMLSKREWIGRHRSGDLRYTALDLDDVAVRVYDGATVLVGRQVQNLTYRGNQVEPQLRTTVVLVRRREDWRLVGVHMSPIGQTPGSAPERPAATA